MTLTLEADDLRGTTITDVPGPRGDYDSKVRAFVEYFLGESIEAFTRRCRAQDPPMSWREIAKAMSRTINETAARLDPDRPPLNVTVSHTVPYQAVAGDSEAGSSAT